MMRESGNMDAMGKVINQRELYVGLGHYPMGNGHQTLKVYQKAKLDSRER